MKLERMPPALVDRLAKHLVALHPFPGAAHAALESVIARGQLRTLQDGEVLCKEGDPGEELWFLLRGGVEVQRIDLGGKTRVLATIDKPGLIGHMALIDRSRRSASCVAKGTTHVVALDARTVEQLQQETTTVGTAMRRLLLSSLSNQLAGANSRMREFVAELKEEQGDDEASVKAVSGDRVDRANAEDSMSQIVDNLSGWGASDLAELVEIEKDVSFVVDEDQKRRNKNRGGGPQ
jgi:CRP-like cAMP-binding protein